jgi:tetratricopeptide (TPR) repeat protein
MNTKLLLSVMCGLLAVASRPVDAQPAPAADQGLDSLSEDRLLGELAQRGLSTLLDRAFEVGQVPQTKQRGVRALLALGRLADPAVKLSPAERRALVTESVEGIEVALPEVEDPRLLMRVASSLIRLAMERDVNTLEYWGEAEKTQQQLLPVAEVVTKLLQKAVEAATAQAELLANQARGLGDPRVAQSEAMVNLATQATYTRFMADYYLTLALPAKSPRRKEVAQAAIAGLAAFDTPDSQVQPAVRNRIGKLHMSAGDYDAARKAFAAVAASDTALQPPPNIAQQYEARYFTAVADMLAGDLEAARSSLGEVVRWQEKALGSDERTRAGAQAAAAMLEHRIYRQEAELAPDEPARRTATEKANATLLELVRQRPELQAVVFEQIAQTLPRNPDLRQLDPLMLQTLVRRGEDERLKPADEDIDEQVIDRALAAARELVRRRGTPGSDPQTVESAALLIPLLLQRIDRPAEAVDAFLDYIRDYGTDPERKRMAMETALALVAELRRDAPDDPTTARVYERILPVAIDPPYDRKEFAFEWARRLQALGRYKEAAAYYQQIPDADPRKAAGQFYQVVTQQQRLDQETMSDAERRAVIASILDGAADVRRRATQANATVTDDAARQMNRSLIARTALLAADVARREQKDPARALTLLADFEQEAAGVPGEQDLLNGALFTRVQAYMQLGQNTQATQTLLTLLRTRGGDEGASIVYNLLQKLNADLDRARAVGDTELVRELAANRASLSGSLVEWAQTNTDANIKRYAYRYQVFDASAKHLAAELDPDPAKRRAGLEQALALYQALLSPVGAQLYLATLEATPGVTPGPDPQVMLGVGLIQYDLGNYQQAQVHLAPLLTERKLGAPTMTVTQDDLTSVEPNEQYWEAVLKLLRSNIAVAAQDPARANLAGETASFLKQLYIQWGKDLAGSKWSKDFDRLRAEIIPDFAPSDIAGTTRPGA